MSLKRDKISKTNKETRYWKYAAWTMPFVGLSALIFVQVLGVDEFITATIAAILTVFFGTSVFWWWWALHKLSFLMKAMHFASESFREVKEDIKEVKEDIHDDSNRQR